MFFDGDYLCVGFSYLALPAALGTLYIIAFLLGVVFESCSLLFGYIAHHEKCRQDHRKKRLLDTIKQIKAVALFDDLPSTEDNDSSINKFVSRLFSICFWIAIIVHFVGNS